MEVVSIIMPAYNAEKYIEDSIKSVLNQTYNYWELLVVNDGSTDSTPAIAARYAAIDSRVKLINQENKRLGGARNTGFANATGKWIALLDADDLWVPVKLEKQILLSAQKPNIDVIYCDGWTFFNDDLNNSQPYPTITGEFTGAQMYKLEYSGNYIPVLAVMFKRSLVERIGLQDVVIQSGCEDWDYWIRMAKAGANFYGMEDRLFYYRRHDSNMSGNHTNMNLAHASLYLKNYDAAVFNKKQGIKIFKPLINPLLIDLLDKGRKQDAEYIYKGIQSVLPSLLNFVNFALIKVIGKKWLLIPKAKFKSKNLFKKIYRVFFKKKVKPGQQIFPEGANVEVATNFCIGKYRNVKLYGSSYRIKIAANVEMREFCNIHVQDTGFLNIEKNVFFNNYCSVNCLNEISIGENTLFGEGVKIYDHNHLYHRPNQQLLLDKLVVEKGKFTKGTVKIGKNCWIGSNVTILNNVEIGDNVIIGANCLIHKSVPANTMVKHAEVLITDQYNQ